MVTINKDLKIIPKLPKSEVGFGSRIAGKKISKEIMPLLIGTLGSFLLLMIIITYLPIILSLKVIGLLIGSFIIIDIQQIIKRSILE